MTAHADAAPISADIVIVGSGMGGGTLAYALRNRGAKVLIVERGTYLPQEPQNWSPTEVFANARYKTTEPFLDGAGKPFQPGIFYGVGGNTKTYGAALPRFRKEDFEALETPGGVSPAWPISYDDLEPYYAEVERLFKVHGQTGIDPTEPWRSTEFPFPAVPHEPVIAELAASFERQGLHPYPLQLGIDLREGGACIRCRTCDGFPCKLLAKSDAETCVVRPALESPDVSMLTNARARRFLTGPDGRSITGLEIEHEGQRRTVTTKTYVLAASAINSAALLLASANDKHPNGLANGSGLVGRGLMKHLNTAVMSVSHKINPIVFQKTMALNDWYLGDATGTKPAGNVQMLGKLQPGMLGMAVPFVPEWALNQVAARSVDWLCMSEDLPNEDNRVTLNASGQVVMAWKPNNTVAHRLLVKALSTAIRRAGYPLIQNRAFDYGMIAHQCGTARMGTDPATSVLDPLCKAHDLDNLYVVDASFLPSSGAQNPALTIAAQALRVADKASFA